MSAQTPCALQVPEILCEVFDHLESDPGTLFAACRVNKVWAEKSLNLLWRDQHRSGMKRLASLTESRRQFYADKIRSFKVEQRPSEYRRCIETLNFPRLRMLEVIVTEKNRDFDHLLVPGLEEFELYGVKSLFEGYLRQVPERCPNLRKLCVGHIGNPHDFDRLEDYLKKFSKLRSIDLTGMSDRTMTDEVFVHLASSPLSELHMNKPITFEMIDLTYGQLPGRLFPSLAHADLRVKWRVAAMLLPTMTTLRELELMLEPFDTGYKALQAVGTLTELRHLTLTAAWEPKSLSREELLAICKLHKLRNLWITGYSMLTLDSSVTNDDLVSFLSSFPEAENIDINAFYTSVIPSSATIALATTSTQLRSYAFNATWDLAFVQSTSDPLFLELKVVYFRGLHYPDPPPAEG